MAVLTPQQIFNYAYRAGFRGADLIRAVAIALAESGGRTDAYNPENAAGTAPGSGSRGLWQIYGTAHPEFNNASVLDPQANANAAYKVYREAGNRFTPWSTWNVGIANKIIPTLPKFKIDSSPSGRSESTTQAVGKMTGTTIGVSGVVGSAGVVAADPGVVETVVTNIKNSLLGKTAQGEQREGADLGAFLLGALLVLIGLIFLFINSPTGKNTVALAGDGVKAAASGGLSKVL